MPSEKSALCSEKLFKQARSLIPGGVNSPVRAFKSVGGNPFFVKKASGAYLTDVDDNTYIDYVNSWGPLILGHAPDVVLAALDEALHHGTSFGAPTEIEVKLAALITEICPAVEMIRMVNSGTEATMSAVRLARGFTGRNCIIKFNGCYHGHADSLLVSAGSGVATFGIPGSPGIPDEVSKLTVSIEYNDANLLEETVRTIGSHNIAAVIIEPVAGNMGLVLPQPGYLEAVRQICTENQIVLIFDEVMTGFRIALGGASERFGVTADLYTFGKIIGGGLPVGAFGGQREIMSKLAPEGPVYQAGTLSGNPLAMTAGYATLKYLYDHRPYSFFDQQTRKLVNGIKRHADQNGVPMQVGCCGGMFGFFFSKLPVTNYLEVKATDVQSYNQFFWAMLNNAVYFAPSAFEAGFLSVKHDDEIIERTIDIAGRVLLKK